MILGKFFSHVFLYTKKVTQESLKLLVGEIGRPRYGSYHIYLTNLLPKASVKQLAEAEVNTAVCMLECCQTSC